MEKDTNISNVRVEEVKEFNYLEYAIQSQSKQETEINDRIEVSIKLHHFLN